jgi:hypothetical protein
LHFMRHLLDGELFHHIPVNEYYVLLYHTK